MLASIDLSAWVKTSNIDKRSNLTVEEFIEKYEKPNIPVVIQDIVPKSFFFVLSVLLIVCLFSVGEQKVKLMIIRRI